MPGLRLGPDRRRSTAKAARPSPVKTRLERNQNREIFCINCFSWYVESNLIEFGDLGPDWIVATYPGKLTGQVGFLFLSSTRSPFCIPICDYLYLLSVLACLSFSLPVRARLRNFSADNMASPTAYLLLLPLEVRTTIMKLLLPSASDLDIPGCNCVGQWCPKQVHRLDADCYLAPGVSTSSIPYFSLRRVNHQIRKEWLNVLQLVPFLTLRWRLAFCHDLCLLEFLESTKYAQQARVEMVRIRLTTFANPFFDATNTVRPANEWGWPVDGVVENTMLLLHKYYHRVNARPITFSVAKAGDNRMISWKLNVEVLGARRNILVQAENENISSTVLK